MKLDEYEQYLFQLTNELVRFLVKNGASIQDAQDTVQDALIKLLKIDNIIPAEKIRSWLYKTSLNLYYNLYNRNKKYNELIEKYFVSDFELMEEELDYSILYRALQRLSENDRQLLLMKYEENLSMKEIAAILDRPEASLKTELYRSRNRLRKFYLEREEKENGF